MVFAAGERNNRGKKDFSKDKKLGSSNGGNVSGPKPNKQKLNRPTRGLVYGPTRREEEMSVSGKRLRVELGAVGRPGGCLQRRG